MPPLINGEEVEEAGAVYYRERCHISYPKNAGEGSWEYKMAGVP
jgi:hypothetical protein